MIGIRIEGNGRVWDFDGSDPIRVGRNVESDVALDDPVVSRLHAELKLEADGWVITDLGGPNGTWIGGQRISRARLGPSTQVHFGHQGGGVDAVVTVANNGSAAPTTPPPSKGMLEETCAIGAFRPGTVVAPALLVSTRHGDQYFPAERPVRIGRDPQLDIVANNPAVSRMHAVVEPRPDGWWFVNQSRTGSFVDGEEVTALRLTGPTIVHLGHPTAGFRFELVPLVGAAEAKQELARRKRAQRPRSRGLKAMVSLIAVAVLGITGVGTFSLLNDESNVKLTATTSAAALETAKKASVEIIAYGADDTPLWSGSGSIISSDGLILTNAHVAAPEAPGAVAMTKDKVTEYRIALRRSDDRPTEPVFTAKTIVADGYLDLAVMKIDGRVDGSPVKAEDIPAPIPVGDSSRLNTGDSITALGYPVLTDDDPTTAESPLTVTRGIVSSFLADPLTNTSRSWIDSDVRIGSGNSGGASINEAGEIVGINTQAWVASNVSDRGFFTSGSSRIRPIALAADVIRIARAGGDAKYVSPFLDKVPAVRGGGWSVDGKAGCDGASELSGVNAGNTIRAEFMVERIPNDMPVAFGFVAEVNGERTVLDQEKALWDRGPAANCLTIAFEVPSGLTEFTAVLLVGPNDDVIAENPVTLTR